MNSKYFYLIYALLFYQLYVKLEGLITTELFSEDFITKRVRWLEDPSEYVLNKIASPEGLITILIYFGFYYSVINRKNWTYIALFFVYTGLQGIALTSKSGIIIAFLNLIIPCLYNNVHLYKYVVFLFSVVVLPPTLYITTHYLSSSSGVLSPVFLLLERSFITDLEGLTTVYESFINQYDYCLAEINRVLYHLRLGPDKTALPHETVALSITGGENLFGELGFAASLTAVGICLYNLGHFGFLYYILICCVAFLINDLLQLATDKKNILMIFIMFLFIQMPIFDLPSAGSLVMSLDNKLGENLNIFLTLAAIYLLILTTKYLNQIPKYSKNLPHLEAKN